jgi:adenylate kinase family enzyme
VIYHPKFNPPPPEVVPRLAWRTDDTPETLNRRLQVYKEKTRPIYGALRGMALRWLRLVASRVG